MIVVVVKGGLGNQLFQYAFGRSLSKKYNTVLKLDLSKYKWTPSRKYGLKYFNIVENIATAEDIKYASGEYKYNEKVFSYNPKLYNYSIGYFNGYFQSEKYFGGIRDFIKKEFKLKNKIKCISDDILRDISKQNSISLNVRRGDYMSGSTGSTHGFCGLDYYNRAIQYIESRVKKPVFYVVSDDINWVKSNIKTKNPLVYIAKKYEVYGDGNVINDTDYEDLIAISYCKHHIIGNSTFAWWGAWLGKYKDKIVVCPTKWFNNNRLQSETSDLIPSEWIKI